ELRCQNLEQPRYVIHGVVEVGADPQALVADADVDAVCSKRVLQTLRNASGNAKSGEMSRTATLRRRNKPATGTLFVDARDKRRKRALDLRRAAPFQQLRKRGLDHRQVDEIAALAEVVAPRAGHEFIRIAAAAGHIGRACAIERVVLERLA